LLLNCPYHVKTPDIAGALERTILLYILVEMPAKIFVGNLPLGVVTNEIIREMFEVYGTVTECDILGSFGFVVSFRQILNWSLIHGK